jgi:hypothetical protein
VGDQGGGRNRREVALVVIVVRALAAGPSALLVWGFLRWGG